MAQPGDARTTRGERAVSAPAEPLPVRPAGRHADTSKKLHRILEYLRVPSPFVGTEIWANPTVAAGNPGAHAYHPPFNRISTYREPGRINLNTIYGDADGSRRRFGGADGRFSPA